MWALYGLALVSHLAGYIEAYQYQIHDNKIKWTQAVENCQRNGSILAVLDTQDKIDELAGKLSSLGYPNADKFWIGLVFNASSQQFEWSSGVTASESVKNFTCGMNPGDHFAPRRNWCYVLKRVTSNSPCFGMQFCDWGHGKGYICQTHNAEVQTPTPSALATHLTNNIEAVATTPSNAGSTVSENGPILKTSKFITSSMNAEIGVSSSSTPLTSALVTHAHINTLADKINAASTTPGNGRNLKTSKFVTSSMNAATTVSPSASEVSRVLEDEPYTNDKVESKNPLLEFSALMNSLNPKDPLSLKVAADAFETLATSVQAEKKSRTGINVIESTQWIEEFAFKYAAFNLNASNTEERRENKHIVLQVSLVPKGYSRNFTFTEEDNSEEVARATLPSFLFHKQDTFVVNTLYRDLHEFVDSSDSRKSKIDSMILGSDVRPSEQETFTENVTIVLRTLEENENTARKSCVFWKWNFSHIANGRWSGDGCSLVDSNRSHVVCTCNHLTNFAILMNVKQLKLPDEHRQALCYFTFTGLGISLLGETITIIAYLLLLCSSNDQQSHVHMNLVATLAMAQIIFLAGINATHDQVLCLTVASLIHYFYLSSFCWMLVEGIMLYLFIIEVYNTDLRLPLCYLFSLGFPGVVVAGTLIIAHLKSEGIHQYTANTWCWLSTEKYYIWSFAGPVVIITAVNMVIFCIVVKEMITMSSMQPSKLSRIKAAVKACVVLFPLLGITWLFGLLSITSTSVVPQYVFTVLNSIQGLLIFIFHCVRNTEIRVMWNKKLKRIKKQAWNFFKVGSPPQMSTSENNSNKQGPSEMELNRRGNKIAPVEG